MRGFFGFGNMECNDYVVACIKNYRARMCFYGALAHGSGDLSPLDPQLKLGRIKKRREGQNEESI